MSTVQNFGRESFADTLAHCKPCVISVPSSPAKSFEISYTATASNPSQPPHKSPGNRPCERVNLEILNVILSHVDAKTTYYAAFAIRTRYRSNLNASLRQLIFEHDMISRQLRTANCSYLSKRRQRDTCWQHENVHRLCSSTV